MMPPAMAPPGLPPETADPISAPVPAPMAPPARVPVCCCGVWQADTDTAPARASARARIFLIIPPVSSVEGGADPVAVVIVGPLGALARRRPPVVGRLRRCRRSDQRASACADRRARERAAR